ncbi:MAG TPA: Rieske 2Fe-2S domain-containing protein [Propionibacteriaceae bacterium]
MLSAQENETLTRVEGDATMGALLRRFWLPAVLSDEVVTGGAPVRVQLLGERLVAFRDSAGRVGVLYERCPHRGASLVLARNEDCALECLYHGWRIDVDGNVLDTPAEPENSTFKDRVKHVAYPTAEVGGLVWVYLGDREDMPPVPNFEWSGLDPAHLVWMKARIECNWLQTLEGALDSSHVNYLHKRADRDREAVLVAQEAAAQGQLPTRIYKGGSGTVMSVDGRPRLEVRDTDYGFCYAAFRKPLAMEDRYSYVRVSHYVAPLCALIPAPANWHQVQLFVPMSDTTTMFYMLRYSPTETASEEVRLEMATAGGIAPGLHMDRNFRKYATEDSNWLQDRKVMEAGDRASGIPGVALEDMAIQESMGPIFDRTREHLATSDLAVIRMRRILLQAANSLRAGDNSKVWARDYQSLHGEEMFLPHGESW